MKNKLAVNGGRKTINYDFKIYNTIGVEEQKSVLKVLKTGKLSPFLGDWGNIPNIGSFYGGQKVKFFENKIQKYFGVKHAISVNSWTSGLIVAVGALDIEPGDEVILSTWTMCATATAIINWLAVPVFVDIDKRTFNIDSNLIRKKINSKTKAIIVTDIFGQAADMDEIKKIAREYNLKIISDSAQSINSKYKNKYTGTIADIGGFSFNYHKQIQTGEGGVLVTNSDYLANRMRLIRNHGEAVVLRKKTKKINNIIGYNFRMGEIEAAIGIEQLKKLKKIVKNNVDKVNYLIKNLRGLKGLIMPFTAKYNTHVYYYFAMQIDRDSVHISRDKIYEALISEGVPIFKSYTLVHLLPMYQRKIAYGKNNFPWSFFNKRISYKKGICPIAENINDNTYLSLPMCNYDYSNKDLKLIIRAFKKVWLNLIEN